MEEMPNMMKEMIIGIFFTLVIYAFIISAIHLGLI